MDTRNIRAPVRWNSRTIYKMKVSRNNYEVWMIDYFDGKLNAVETEALLAFLDINPDLKEEFELFDPSPLELEDIQFSNKHSLKKTEVVAVDQINERNYEEYFIAFYENDLSETQIYGLNKFRLKNPYLEKEFLLHQNLFATADQSITFNNKTSLKRKPRIAAYWWSGAVAAAVVLLFGWIGFLQQDKVVIPTRENMAISRLQPAPAGLEISSVPNIIFIEANFPRAVIASMPIRENQRENLSVYKMDKQTVSISLVNPSDYSTIEIKPANKPTTTYALADASKVSQKRKGALGRIIKNLVTRTTDDLPDNNTKDKNRKDPTFVRMLGQGITVFNTLTGSDTELTKSYDENGNLTHYQMEGETLSWSKNYTQGANTE
jgi:hypothetical protein